jgi:uncharacterized RmlC-like cupin family protein
MRAHRFFYAPNAHSHWHSHTGKQTLYFVFGTGRIKKEGEEAFRVQPGDLVYVAPWGKALAWSNSGSVPRSLRVYGQRQDPMVGRSNGGRVPKRAIMMRSTMSCPVSGSIARQRRCPCVL